MSFPIASVLASQLITGSWWPLLVRQVFVWPHLAWQLASKAVDPLHSEYANLKADAILAGMWMGIMGMNLLPSMVLLMIICIGLMSAGGMRVPIAGAVLMVILYLVTLQLTDIPVAFSSM